jgi:hypothetical protein
MQWLLKPTREELDRLVAESALKGFRTTKGELVSAFALATDVASASGAIEIHRRRAARIRPPSNRGTPLLLRIPSPISLRIDGLISEMRGLGDRAFRYELVGGLIAEAVQLDQGEVKMRCQSFRSGTAEEAALKGRSPGEVLAKTPPRPGARKHFESAA